MHALPRVVVMTTRQATWLKQVSFVVALIQVEESSSGHQGTISFHVSCITSRGQHRHSSAAGALGASLTSYNEYNQRRLSFGPKQRMSQSHSNSEKPEMHDHHSCPLCLSLSGSLLLISWLHLYYKLWILSAPKDLAWENRIYHMIELVCG